MKRLVLYALAAVVLFVQVQKHDVSFIAGFVLGAISAVTLGYSLAVRTNGRQMVSTGAHRFLTGKF